MNNKTKSKKIIFSIITVFICIILISIYIYKKNTTINLSIITNSDDYTVSQGVVDKSSAIINISGLSNEDDIKDLSTTLYEQCKSWNKDKVTINYFISDEYVKDYDFNTNGLKSCVIFDYTKSQIQFSTYQTTTKTSNSLIPVKKTDEISINTIKNKTIIDLNIDDMINTTPSDILGQCEETISFFRTLNSENNYTQVELHVLTNNNVIYECNTNFESMLKTTLLIDMN